MAGRARIHTYDIIHNHVHIPMIGVNGDDVDAVLALEILSR